MENNKLVFYIDGASRGNPGPAGAGVLVCDADRKGLYGVKKYIGETTNNVAEYIALIIALQEAVKARVKDVAVYSDSELVVRQIMGRYRVRDDKLKHLYALFENLKGYFKSFSIRYIDRDKNKKADKLAAEAAMKRNTVLSRKIGYS